MYHYWISDAKSNILNVYKLNTMGETVFIKRKIYQETKRIKTNRTISMVENKIISEMNIKDEYRMVYLSEKCRILFNDQITILEMDGFNCDIALDIFSLISNTNDENDEDELVYFVIFDIDDERIKSDKFNNSYNNLI